MQNTKQLQNGENMSGIRRKDREITEVSEIIKVLDKAKILHLGLIDGAYPYIVPLHYGYEYSEAHGTFTFYMHSAQTGHKIDLIQSSLKGTVQIDTDVALLSGGDVPCQYGSLYSSFIGRGTVCIVSSTAEKKHGLELLMKNQTGKDFEFTEQMLENVAVIKIKVYDYTAKARTK